QAVTWRQFQVLSLLAKHGQLAQVELAERLSIYPATLVGALDRMERAGPIARTGCLHDRRRRQLKPLPNAEAVWRKIIDCEKRIRARANRGLTPEQLQTLHRLLGSVQASLSREPASTTATTACPTDINPPRPASPRVKAL